MDISRIKAMALKEYKHIVRDKFTVIIGIGLPVILVIFFGFIIDLNYKDIRIIAKDESMTRQSREFAESFYSSGYFDLKYILNEDPVNYLENDKTAVAMVIKDDFGRKSAKSEQALVQILIDGSDNTKASSASSYLNGIIEKASRRLNPEMPEAKYELRTRFLFNPELNSKWFIVPGLVVVIIGLLAILLTSMTIAKEWEKGSMELLLSTHIKPLEIVLGKIIPYFLLSFVGALSVFFVARTVFAVPFTGSILVFFFSCCIYITSCLSLGILISVATRQQQLAMMIAMAAGLLPSILLSGFIFPIENMPLFFRAATFVLPQRWFMEICRGVFLRGAGFSDLLLPLSMICLFCVFIIFAAVKNFKTDVEP